ncbi:hypothetical protein CCMA1212_007730 [Trichoderma ghanense]|uniref:Uncharacterized protein n=1 Tax=Trichoderma ghanense TaxID=65468 RepID=A0ABY2H000_9HYPO
MSRPDISKHQSLMERKGSPEVDMKEFLSSTSIKSGPTGFAIFQPRQALVMLNLGKHAICGVVRFSTPQKCINFLVNQQPMNDLEASIF